MNCENGATKSEQILVVGAGLMGHGIAQLFASHGYKLTLADIREDILSRALNRIRENLLLLNEKGHFDSGKIDSTLERIATTVNFEAQAHEADLVIEAAPEDLRLKQNLFRRLDEYCRPETILATNTSVISITEIARAARIRNRIVGTHFWNPPYLIPLVEVVPGEETSPDVIEKTLNHLRKVGKHPVRVRKDVPGFVGNRLQHALWREAISIVEKGIADPETVDEVVKKGFGIRLPVLGPLENADMVGLDLTWAIHDYLLKHLEASPSPSALLRDKVQRGELGFRTGVGFRKWSNKEAERTRKKLIDYLLTRCESLEDP